MVSHSGLMTIMDRAVRKAAPRLRTKSDETQKHRDDADERAREQEAFALVVELADQRE